MVLSILFISEISKIVLIGTSIFELYHIHIDIFRNKKNKFL
jgi:hypothetical protein